MDEACRSTHNFLQGVILTQAADSFTFCNFNVYIFTLRGHRMFNASLWTGREEREEKKKELLLIFSQLGKFHFVCVCVCVFKEDFSQRYWAFTRDRCSRICHKDTKLSSSPKFELVLRSSGDEKGTTYVFVKKSSFFALGTLKLFWWRKNTHENF